MITKAVIGLGFGDEGKGKVVSTLCSQSPNSLVIRYCGGHQAAHHVVLRDGRDHVFSNFGSGAFQGCSTYWTKFCTVDPIGVLTELELLKLKINDNITLYIHPNCPVTTPYEKITNRNIEKINNHGSCGVGVGQTFQREEDLFSIQFIDLYYPSVLKIKLELLQKYYGFDMDMEPFFSNCMELIEQGNILIWDDSLYNNYESLIYEGSQGLLLDQHIGFFPHVTRANTGIRNIWELPYGSSELFFVTRAYQTRHGNGPMTNNEIPHSISNNPYERNSDRTFQGKFRISILDIDLLRYALDKEPYVKNWGNKTIVITCLDLIERYTMTIKGRLKEFADEKEFVNGICSHLGFQKCLLSRTPFPEVENG